MKTNIPKTEDKIYCSIRISKVKSTDYGVVTIRSSSSPESDDEDKDKLPESEDKPDEYKPDEDKIPKTEDKDTVGISNVKSTDYGVVTIRSSSSPESDDEDKDKLPESEDKPDEYKPDEDKIPKTEDKYIVQSTNVKSTDYGVVTIRSSSSLVPDDEDQDKLPQREDKPDEYNPDEDKIPETEDKDTVGISNVKSTDYGVVTIRSSSSPESDDEDKDKLPESEDKPDEDKPDEDKIPKTEDKYIVQINSNVKSTDYGVVTIRSSSSPESDDEDKDKLPESEDKPDEYKPDEDKIPKTEDKYIVGISNVKSTDYGVCYNSIFLLLLNLMMKIKTSYLKVKTNQMKINEMKTKYLKLKTNYTVRISNVKSTDYGVVTIRSSSSPLPDDEDKDKLPEREDKPDEDKPDEDKIPEPEDKDTVNTISNAKSTDYGVVTIRSSSSPESDDEDKDKLPESEDKSDEDKPDEDNIHETEDNYTVQLTKVKIY